MILMRQLLCVILGTVLALLLACEPHYDLHFKLDEGRMPPTFSFFGNSAAYEFEILQLPRSEPLSRTNPFNFTGETLWKVAPEKK